MTTFGQKVKAARQGKGWTQEELARRAGLSRNYLSQIERGEATNLSWDIVRRLVNTLNLQHPEDGEWKLYVWNWGHAYGVLARSLSEAKRLILERYGALEMLETAPAMVIEAPTAFCVTFGAWDAAEKPEGPPRDGYKQARGVIPWDGEPGEVTIRRIRDGNARRFRGAIGDVPVEVLIPEETLERWEEE